MKQCICIFLCLFGLAVADGKEKNAIIPCENSLELFEWDLEFIRHAQHSIDIAPCFIGGTVAQELLTTIEARLEVCPDLQVHVLATPILLEPNNCEILDRLKKNYPYNFHLEHATNLIVIWPDVTGIDNHVKVCVVDEHYFSMGGTNLQTSHCSDGTYTPPKPTNTSNDIADNLFAGTRDQDIAGRGPIAKQMRQKFCQLFAIWNHYNKYERLEKNPAAFKENPFYFEISEKPFVESFESSDRAIEFEEDQVSYILSGPHQKKNAISAEYLRLIKSAQEELTIANLYINPTDEIYQALLDAVNRGVKLTLITNGVSETSPEYNKYFCWANRINYLPLFHGKPFRFWERKTAKNAPRNTTRLFEYAVNDVLIHKKVMMVDGHTAVIGSYNLGIKSHLADYETVMVMRSPEMVREFKRIYQIDLAHSKEVSHDEALDWYFDPIITYIGNLQKRFAGLL